MQKIVEYVWKTIEFVLHFIIRKVLQIELNDNSWEEVLQFVKFGIVGLMNNAISYVTYLICIRVGIHYILANIIGFTVSVINSFYWNNKYVFGKGEDRVWWKTFIKSYVSYAGTGIILSNVLLYVWVGILNIPEGIAPLISLIITVPINYIMNKLWAFKK